MRKAIFVAVMWCGRQQQRMVGGGGQLFGKLVAARLFHVVGAPAATRAQTGANGARTAGASRSASRSGLVFIQTATGSAPPLGPLGPADYDFPAVPRGLAEGDEVPLPVLRYGKTIDVKTTLAAKPTTTSP